MANAASGVAVNDDCKLKLDELRTKRAHRFIIFKIDDQMQEVVVEKVGDRAASYEEFTAGLPSDDCRYAVYDYDLTADAEVHRSKIFFVSWSPETANVRSKMLYASSNEGFKNELDGIQVDLQATDPSEITLDVIKEHAS